MSMEVDLTSPLTREEREYLAMRGRNADINRVDELHGTEDAPSLGDGDGTGPAYRPLGTAEQAAEERERLLARLRELDAIEGTGSSAEDEGDDDDVAPYEEWKSAELDAEIDRRNVGRPEGSKISKAGKVSERANRLYEDDAANTE